MFEHSTIERIKDNRISINHHLTHSLFPRLPTASCSIFCISHVPGSIKNTPFPRRSEINQSTSFSGSVQICRGCHRNKTQKKRQKGERNEFDARSDTQFTSTRSSDNLRHPRVAPPPQARAFCKRKKKRYHRSPGRGRTVVPFKKFQPLKSYRKRTGRTATAVGFPLASISASINDNTPARGPRARGTEPRSDRALRVKPMRLRGAV